MNDSFAGKVSVISVQSLHNAGKNKIPQKRAAKNWLFSELDSE